MLFTTPPATLPGTIVFNAAANTGVDFAGVGGTVQLGNGFNLTGSVDNTGAANNGTLTLDGTSIISEAVGGTNPIGAINLGAAGAGSVATFNNNVAANSFTFNNASTAVVGGTLAVATDVNFNGTASTLTFNGAAGPYTFANAVANVPAAGSTLNVQTTLEVTDQSVLTLSNINIGTAGTAGNFTPNIDEAALSLNTINFLNANSTLTLAPLQAQAVTFNNNLTGSSAAGGGILNLDGTNALTLNSTTGATIGTAGAKLSQINVKGKVTVIGAAGNLLNVSNTNELNLAAGSVFTDQSRTSATIAKINIGEAGGAATYALDAKNADILALNTGGMVFGNAGSKLQLASSAPAGTNRTITLAGDLDPNALNTGIVSINAVNAGETLTVDGNFNLGINGGNTIQSVEFIGKGEIIMQQPTINVAQAISTGVTNLTLGNVNVGINFTDTTNLTVGNVGGNIDFKSLAGTTNLTANSVVTGQVISTGGVNGTLVFQGAGGVTGAIGNIAAINFNGAGAVTLGSTSNATNFTIGNVGADVTAKGLMTGNVNFAANANGTLILQNGLNGAVTTSEANNGTLAIDGGNVTGTIGATGALALVNIGANAVTFGTNVSSQTIALTQNASDLTLGNGVAVTGAITTANGGNGTLTLNAGSSVNGTIGANGTALASINVVGAATLSDSVFATKTILTAPGSALTLDDNVVLTGDITTASPGNGVLTLNPGSSVNGTIGAANNALATVNIGAGIASFDNNVFANQVVLNDTSALTLNNSTITGAVTTASPNNGTLTLNAGSSVTETIGAAGNALALINVTAAGTTFLKDVYANNVKLTTNASTLTLNPNVKLTGAITTGSNNNGTLTLNAGSSVTETIGASGAALALIDVKGAATLSANVFATTTTLSTANSALTLGDGVKLTGAVTTANDGAGTLTLNTGSSVTGTIGAANNALALIDVVGAATLSKNVFATTTTLSNAASALTLDNNVKLTGAITTANNGDGTLTLNQGSSVTGAIGVAGKALALINVTAAGATFSADVFANNVKLATSASTLTLANGIKLTGAVTTGTNNTGTLTLNAGSSVTETIGADGAALALVNIGAGAVQFNKNVFANNVKLTANSVLTLANDVALKGAITTASPGNGVLTLNPGSSVDGTIGANGTALATVNIGAGAASFGDDVFANQVVLTANTSALTLNNSIITGAVTTLVDNTGTLTLIDGSSVTGTIGTAVNKLEKVNIGAETASFNADVYSNIVALTTPTSVLTLNVGSKVNGDITTTAGNNTGAVIFNGGAITGAIGAANGGALKTVTFNASANLPVASFAQTFTVSNAAAVVTAPGGVTGDVVAGAGQFTGNTTGNVSVGTGQFTGTITGTATFTGAGTITTGNVGGTTNFAGFAGKVNINNGGNLAGVTSTGNNGSLIFAGGANVTGAITTIGAITLNGAAPETVNFQESVSAASLKLSSDGTANLKGSLTTTGNVDFNNKAGVLQFSGTVEPVYQLKSSIANAGNATLNVDTNLTATNSTIGTIKTINISKNVAAKAFTIDVSNGALNLLQPANSTITFGDADSTFALTTAADQIVTFSNNIVGLGGPGGGGKVNLGSTNGATLIVQGLNGTQTIGGAATKIASLNITGNVTVAGAKGTTKLDVTNTEILNLKAGSVFTDQGLTSAQVAPINIGEATGPATYALDAVNGDFILNAPGLNFVDNASVLKLQTSVLTGKTSNITLTGNLAPAEKTGIVELNAQNTGANLLLKGAAFSLGTEGLSHYYRLLFPARVTLE